MGQYHKLVNVDKKELVHPHHLDLGLKQWEHLGNFLGTLADAMYILMMTSPNRGGGDLPKTDISGRWAGDRVLVLGDYTEDSDVPSIPELGSLYRNSEENYVDISWMVVEAFAVAFKIKVEV